MQSPALGSPRARLVLAPWPGRLPFDASPFSSPAAFVGGEACPLSACHGILSAGVSRRARLRGQCAALLGERRIQQDKPMAHRIMLPSSEIPKHLHSLRLQVADGALVRGL